METTNAIITIGRQYASWGRKIGEDLAKKLNIPYYDKEILNLAAKQSGICKELFLQNDEKPNISLLFSMVTGYRSGDINSVYMDLPLNHKIFLAQFDAIKDIAKQGPCVIVGRCADYVLRDNPQALNIFLYGDLEVRIKNAMELYNMEYKQAKDIVNKIDRQRSSYYSYFAGEDWGKKENYHLCLNTSHVSIEDAVDFIASYAIKWKVKA